MRNESVLRSSSNPKGLPVPEGRRNVRVEGGPINESGIIPVS